MQAIERITAAAARGQLVVVVGTGITVGLTNGAATSTWTGLITDGVARVGDIDSNRGALLQMNLDAAKDSADLISVAQGVKRNLGENFGRWVARAVGDLKPVHRATAEAIGRLGVPILTTNYDDLLEKVLSRPHATWKQPDEMRAILTAKSEAIGHLHGWWKDPENIVFSESDYEAVMRDQDAQAVQNAAFTMKTFMFIGVGAGLTDPNFSPMVQDFSDRFPASADTHFRLCLTSEVDPASALRSIVDVGVGDSYADLVKFLDEVSAAVRTPEADLGARSKEVLLDHLRENSTLWRDAETLNEKSVTDLIVEPIFLPEPHDQYATNTVIGAEKDKPAPVDLSQRLMDGGVILIAGEESSGVSTALTYALLRALDLRQHAHAMLIGEPLKAGIRPVGRQIDRLYKEWGSEDPLELVRDRLVLGVDNLRLEDSQRFNRAIDDIAAASGSLKLVGLRQGDVAAVAGILSEKLEQDVTVVFLGRFSSAEATELARRVAPGREAKVARHVMIVVREKNLPRTPFTITLLVELIQSGVVLQKEESEIAVLDQYLNLLLSADFIRTRTHLSMTLRNKRRALESLARKFVESKEDKASRTQVIEWLTQQFSQLGWEHDAELCLDDLIDRRVLSRSVDNTIRFQRSAYLELMAGLAAKDDSEFRAMVFKSPLELASIVRTYAAMTRNDEEVLELVENEIDRIAVRSPQGNVFRSVRRIEAKKELFKDRVEVEDADAADTQHAENGADGHVEREGMTGQYYDDSDDSDYPAFMTARLEDLSEARVAMLVVDLASRVLRDADEVRDQDLKRRILQKLLLAWVSFTDLYEVEVEAYSDLDQVVAAFYPEDQDEVKVEKLKAFLNKLLPSLLTESGIRYCLSGPNLVSRLAELDFSSSTNGSYASLMRTLTLYASKSRKWIDSLKDLDDAAVQSFFGATYFAASARYAFIADRTLSDDDRDAIRAFLRRVIAARYSFRDIPHKNTVLNDFEDSLRRARLQEGRNQSPAMLER